MSCSAPDEGGTARVGFGYGVFCKRDSANNRYVFVVWHTMAAIEKRFDGRSETLGTFAGVRSLSQEEPSKELKLSVRALRRQRTFSSGSTGE